MARTSNSERREQFMRAAANVIADVGIAKASTRRIAQAAGAPLGALHYCFDSKDELLVETLLAGSERLFGMFEHETLEEEGLPSAVAMVVRRHVEWFLSEKEFELAQFEVLLWAMHEAGTDAIARKVYDSYVGVCRRALEAHAPGNDPALIASLARAIVAVADGLTLQHLAGESEERIREDAELVVRALSSFAAGVTAGGAERR